jgi:hypothetical protein
MARTLALIVLLGLAPFARAMGADHPSAPVTGTQWPLGVANLVNASNRVHGYWYNDYDCFFFKGDTADLNAFLAACGRTPSTTYVTIHPGKLDVRSPWDQKPRDVQGNWTLAISGGRLSTLGDGMPGGYGVVRVDLYLDGTIRLGELQIPKNMIVRSGGEIEAFVREHPSK